MNIDTSLKNTVHYISVADAVKSIKRLISLTGNDASKSSMDIDAPNNSFMACYRLLCSAETANNGKTPGILMASCLNGNKCLEWAGTWTRNKRIQWNWPEEEDNGDVQVFMSSGTGKKSNFIDSVFEGVYATGRGGKMDEWIISLED